MDDYGIGSAAAAALHVYEGASRGSGRTTRMVRDLRGHQVVVCPNYDEKQRVERLIREMRPAIAHVVVVSLDGRKTAREQLHGFLNRHPGKDLVLDHTVVLRLYEEAIAQVREDFELERGRFEAMGPDVVEPVARYEPGRRVL